jgi:Calcineurin-like phosphoesterase
MQADDVTSQETSPPEKFRSSRLADLDAGWGCRQRGRFAQLMPDKAVRFSWLRPSVLWRSRNDILAKLIHDPTDATRARWVTAQLARGADPDLRVDPSHPAAAARRRAGEPAPDEWDGGDPGRAGRPPRPGETMGKEFSFLLLGDTGEGDMSQYAVVPCLMARSEGTDFAVIASDVIYPEGEIDGYADKFFRPYQGYPKPIYALPGNHDWYDDLNGFMRIFCAAPEPPPEPRVPLWPLRPWLRSLIWRRSGPADEAALAAGQALRGRPEQQAVQPGPYWMIDTPSLRIIAIDPGIGGRLDAAQGEWFRRVSAGSKPKLLITGKPIYRDNRHYPCPIEGGGTVDDVARDPRRGFVAVIGGDIHNYQRYPVQVGDRVLHYFVAGGGGAFMHATHQIPRVDVAGVDESDFRCYPLRGDSLSFYSQLYDRRLRAGGRLEISPTQAAAYMSERVGEGTSPRLSGTRVPVERRTKIVAWLLDRLPVGRAFHKLFSEFSDWDHPPFFKSFLRIDVTASRVRLRCFAATGCLEHEIDPPLEDEVVISLPPPVPEPRAGADPARAERPAAAEHPGDPAYPAAADPGDPERPATPESPAGT